MKRFRVRGEIESNIQVFCFMGFYGEVTMVIGIIILCLLTGWASLHILVALLERSDRKEKESKDKIKKNIRVPEWVHSILGTLIGFAVMIAVMYILSLLGVPI